MKNLSVKKQYIIINAIMCFVVAVIAIACITFTSMPTRPTTVTTADNDIPLSDTSYDGNGQLCGKNLFNKDAPKHPRFNSISTSNSSGHDYLTASVCNTTGYFLPRIKLKLKPTTCYTVSFFVNFYDTLLSPGTTAPGTVESRFRFLENDMEYGYSFCESMIITGNSQKFVYTFTTANSFNFNYIAFGYFSPISISYNLLLRDFQIEEGSTATSYEPFVGSSNEFVPQIFDYSIFNRNLKDTCIIGSFVYSRNFEYILTLPDNYMSGINTTDSLVLAILSKDGKHIDSDILYTGCGVSQPFNVNNQPELSSGRVIILYYNTYIGGNTSFTVDSCKGVKLSSTYIGNIDAIYDNVYKEGYDMGNADGLEKGESNGRKWGYDDGYTIGMKDGAATWDNLFPSIFGAIGGFFKNMLDINVLGMNLLSILGGVGAIIISLVLIRLVVK